MDISKAEQRILHVLAQGGVVRVERDDKRHITKLECMTRDGWYLTGLTLHIFRKLKRRRFIISQKSQPYRITRRGLAVVRSQGDNR